MKLSNYILHIDDDVDDLYVFKEALAVVSKEYVLRQEQEAFSALRFLHSLDNDHLLPQLIVVDLNMPGVSGKEFLSVIHEHPFLRRIPILAFTTSSLQTDRDYCARFGAGCITKPGLFSEMLETIAGMLDFCKERRLNTQ